ncbi:hypothetical protein [Raoultella planticola]|uniref:hypothetical protein n=1 Tax=Raoultella planticola TaxID=575 RepID=UPI002228380D|nr:hypothetical protein [Raoultella planticola]
MNSDISTWLKSLILFNKNRSNNAAVFVQLLTAAGVSCGGRGLELVSHTQSDDVVIVDSEFIIAVQLVDL